jgi:DNA-binding NtrC family response regulator
MTRSRILIVHPDPAVAALLGSMLRSPRLEIIEAISRATAVRMLATAPALIVMGVGPDESKVPDLLYHVPRKLPGTPVILVAERPDHFRRTIPLGAVAVVEFPPPAGLLRGVVEEALRTDRAGCLGGEAVAMPSTAPLRPLKETMEELEREVLARVLRALGGSRRDAARVLEINRTTLYLKMRKYGLTAVRAD